jgi:hypothetical protein
METPAIMKTWTKPSIREIQMNAEIGSYQPDWDGGVDRFVPAERKHLSVDARPSLGEAAGTVGTLPGA